MKIHSTSGFKDPTRDLAYFQDWVRRLEEINQVKYSRIDLSTSLGKTVVWGINLTSHHLKSLVIFPGFRTCSLFWDFDQALAVLKPHYRIFLVDTNGQPSLSDGNTPDIRSDGYGIWAHEVLTGLNIDNTAVAGASFGGLVCLKLAMVASDKIDKVILLNPGCLQPFSLSLKNLYYNMLPILFPSRKNVKTFLDNGVFCKPHHELSPEAEQLIIDYEVFALTRFKDRGQKPYEMSPAELQKINTPVYLLEGDKDLLFPFQKSIDYARQHIKTLKDVFVLKHTGHGIETSKEAMQVVKTILEK
jgi:pimeloyl-ACP methyl ester carboxylesterase